MTITTHSTFISLDTSSHICGDTLLSSMHWARSLCIFIFSTPGKVVTDKSALLLLLPSRYLFPSLSLFSEVGQLVSASAEGSQLGRRRPTVDSLLQMRYS